MCATNNFQDFVKENFYSGKKDLRVSNDRREQISNLKWIDVLKNRERREEEEEKKFICTPRYFMKRHFPSSL